MTNIQTIQEFATIQSTNVTLPNCSGNSEVLRLNNLACGSLPRGVINLQSTLARGFVLPNGAPNPLHPPVIVRLSMALDGTEFARICRARDRLCDLQTPSMTVDRIAREAGISHFHFIRRFRAIFGVTPPPISNRCSVERCSTTSCQGRFRYRSLSVCRVRERRFVQSAFCKTNWP